MDLDHIMVWSINKTLPLMELGDSGRRDRWVDILCQEHSEPELMLCCCQDDPHISKGLQSIALRSAGHGWISVPDTGLDGQSFPDTSP